ncbi:MAG: hypothetical protein VKJ46_12875 [Leptolyngbyaceae bacterium]|nr:hypothetical protein [Leptolyngbyaceae bacterium]
MTDLNLSQEPKQSSRNREESPASASAYVPLGEAIKRGWDWVVFSWSMLQRLGSFQEVVRTFVTVISLLTKRTLIQWGLLKKG